MVGTSAKDLSLSAPNNYIHAFLFLLKHIIVYYYTYLARISTCYFYVYFHYILHLETTVQHIFREVESL